MKNLLAVTLVFMFGIGASHAENKTYETGLPDVFVKHVGCSGGATLHFSLVNKSKNDLAGIKVRVSVIDPDGDPVDSGMAATSYLDANSGHRALIGVRCDLGTDYKFKVVK